MAPTIHFLRHAQGAHNASQDAEALIDPGLTAQGEMQCADFASSFLFHEKVKHVVSSPMRRAIQTATLAAAVPAGLHVEAWDTVQETSDAPNDIGSDVGMLRDEFGSAVDLEMVRHGWNNKDKDSVFEPQWDKLLARTQEARRALRRLAGSENDHIVVVSHGGVLHFLTEDWQDLSLQRRSTWSNCEYRSYQFCDDTDQDENATLRETDESWQRRGGSGQAPSREQQLQMRAQVEQWIVPVLKVSR